MEPCCLEMVNVLLKAVKNLILVRKGKTKAKGLGYTKGMLHLLIFIDSMRTTLSFTAPHSGNIHNQRRRCYVRCDDCKK